VQRAITILRAGHDAAPRTNLVRASVILEGTAGSGDVEDGARGLLVAAEGRVAPAESEREPIREESDLEEFQHVFANVEYWKRIGEEYQQPLIVTGTVMFTPLQTTQLVQREREVYDSFGRRSVVAQRTFQDRRGFSLDGRFIFIDGRDGTTLHSETFGEQILYSANQVTPALSSYFELMDRLIPTFLSTLNSQQIRGTRVLLN